MASVVAMLAALIVASVAQAQRVYWADRSTIYTATESNPEPRVVIDGALPSDPQLEGGYVYWVQARELFRRVTTGGPTELVATMPGEPARVWRVDSEEQVVFWIARDELLYRADFFGVSAEAVTEAGSFVTDVAAQYLPALALDRSRSRVYFKRGQQNAQSIWSADYDGQSATFVSDPTGGDTDIIEMYARPDDRLYWVERSPYSFLTEIVRSDLDGSNVMEVASFFNGALIRLQFDDTTDRIYWGGRGTPVRRVNSDGTGLEELFNLSTGTRVALDSATQRLYYYGQSELIAYEIADGSNTTIAPSERRISFPSFDAASNSLFGIGSNFGDSELLQVDVATASPTTVAAPAFRTLTAMTMDPATQTIAYAADDRLFLGNADGSDLRCIVDETTQPTSIALDLANDSIYWTTEWFVNRVNVQTGEQTTLVADVIPINSLALDTAGDRLFWATAFWLGASGTDGGDAQVIKYATAVPNLTFAYRHINYSPRHDALYLLQERTDNLTPFHDILSVDPVGSGDVTLFSRRLGGISSLTIDDTNDQVVWISGAIESLGTDGQNLREVIGDLSLNGFPVAISVDPTTAACICERDGDTSTISIADLLAYLADWVEDAPAADLDGDGEVRIEDLLEFLACWLTAEGSDCE